MDAVTTSFSQNHNNADSSFEKLRRIPIHQRKVNKVVDLMDIEDLKLHPKNKEEMETSIKIIKNYRSVIGVDFGIECIPLHKKRHVIISIYNLNFHYICT